MIGLAPLSALRSPLTSLGLIFLLLPPAAWADGLPDQGFDDGAPYVQTEYIASNEGTVANPLTIDLCVFLPSPAPECQSPPATYDQSNFWSQNAPSGCYPWVHCSHWDLILNNEDAFSGLNPGPPDASLPRALPGSGIFGFNTIYDNFAGTSVPGDSMWRAHLVLNLSSQFANPTVNKLPYMAVGAWSGRGTKARSV